ncbi:hypothetical protein C8R46DRAFT_1096117 [Mycena filopes]|nr:hypothetical protein C8R46DRAFT_1096117 [Mycena filopes]
MRAFLKKEFQLIAEANNTSRSFVRNAFRELGNITQTIQAVEVFQRLQKPSGDGNELDSDEDVERVILKTEKPVSKKRRHESDEEPDESDEERPRKRLASVKPAPRKPASSAAKPVSRAPSTSKGKHKAVDSDEEEDERPKQRPSKAKSAPKKAKPVSKAVGKKKSKIPAWCIDNEDADPTYDPGASKPKSRASRQSRPSPQL